MFNLYYLVADFRYKIIRTEKYNYAVAAAAAAAAEVRRVRRWRYFVAHTVTTQYAVNIVMAFVS